MDISLEQQLFSWSEWDNTDVNNFMFYDIVLKVPIGDFPVGTKFVSAYFSNEQSFVQFTDETGKAYEFKLKVMIVYD